MKRTRVRQLPLIDRLHVCKKVRPCTKALPLSGIRQCIKQGLRKRKKIGRETGKTEVKKLMERKAYLGTAKVNKILVSLLNKILTKMNNKVRYEESETKLSVLNHLKLKLIKAQQTSIYNFTTYTYKFWNQRVRVNSKQLSKEAIQAKGRRIFDAGSNGEHSIPAKNRYIANEMWGDSQRK